MRKIREETYQAIKRFLNGFLDELVEEYKNRQLQEFETAKEYLKRSSSQGRLKPFQSAIIPSEFLLINDMVLIGDEFWNLIAGKSAFEKLLNIYREVGEEKRQYLIETLAFQSP